MSTIVLSGLKKKILLAGFTFTVSLFLFLIYLYYKYGRIITYKFFSWITSDKYLWFK